ncbi:MAG: hypothetical protein WB816_02965 [Methylocystis sp.]
MSALVPLHVELADIAKFFEDCAKGGVVFDREAASAFAEEIAFFAKRAEALEGAPASALVPQLNHDLSHSIGAMADLFKGHSKKGANLSPQAVAKIEKMLRRDQELARGLEHISNNALKALHAAKALIGEQGHALDGKTMERERAVAHGIMDGKVIDIGVHRAMREPIAGDMGGTP